MIPDHELKEITLCVPPGMSDAEKQNWISERVKRRESGEILAYLTGKRVFLDHEYQVGKGVLVPRPETEVLVRAVGEYITPQMRLGAEIGLGSGAISIELLSKFPSISMVGTEISKVALDYANKNAVAILGSTRRIKFVAHDSVRAVMGPLRFALQRGKVDFIVSNPPYLASQDEIAQDVLEQEPKEALFAFDENPDYFYREIANEALEILKPHGFLAFEIPHERADQISTLFIEKGFKTLIQNDLTGRARVLLAWPPNG